MGGGIAILLLVIIAVVAAVIGIALYVTGGALWFGKTSPEGDKIEGSDRDGGRQRPRHKEVTSETIENTKLAGTPDDH
jgi:hypothetical protein